LELPESLPDELDESLADFSELPDELPELSEPPAAESLPAGTVLAPLRLSVR
jgi:hypothetical protein